MYGASYTTAAGFDLPGVRRLIIATVAAYAAQVLADRLTGGLWTDWLSLSRDGLRHAALWQPVTYLFLHGNLWHLLLNMLGLFFFGPEVERRLGTRRFMALYGVCGVLAGLGWLAFSGGPLVRCLGASGAVFGVLGTFAALFPTRPVTLLVLFVIPVTMRARTLAIGLGLFNLLAMMHQPGAIAYAAHVAGGAAGYLYGLRARYGGLPRGAFDPRRWWNDLRWQWLRRRFRAVPGYPAPADPDAREEPTPAAVDQILDALSRRGFGSLSARDRDVLERASRRPGSRPGTAGDDMAGDL